jgi:electron transport complex protein RnfD
LEKRLVVAVSPSIRDSVSTTTIMWGVVVALIPSLAISLYFFRTRAAIILLVSSLTAIGMEALFQRFNRQKITVTDGSALITGLLLAYNLPPGVPLWIPVVGSAFAVIVAKQLFGGLGYNFINPALAGRAFLMASWPEIMTHRWMPTANGVLSGIDAMTTATPLGTLKEATRVLTDPGSTAVQLETAGQALEQLSSSPSLVNLLWGNVGGCIGETSAIMLIIGASYLLFKRYMDWRIPLSYVGTVALLSWLIPSGVTPLFHLLSGGLILGAFFMATDPVTSPITQRGRWIFGLGCGVITFVIRRWGGYPEGVSYSILLMNCATPLIDKLTKPKRMGERR